jgi:hypothetical protein
LTSLTIIGTAASIIAAIFAVMNYKKGHQPLISITVLSEPGYREFPERFGIGYTNSSSNSCYVWISCLIKIASTSINIPQSKRFAGASEDRVIHVDLAKTEKKLELEKMRHMPVTAQVSCSYELFHLIGVTEGVTETYRFEWNQSFKTWADKERISAKHHITFGRRPFGQKNTNL